jgi:alcohol dehydrogenase class IV
MTEVEAAESVVGATRAFMAKVGVPRLRELRTLKPDDLEELARLSADHVCSPDNARDISYDDYLELFREAAAA